MKFNKFKNKIVYSLTKVAKITFLLLFFIICFSGYLLFTPNGQKTLLKSLAYITSRTSKYSLEYDDFNGDLLKNFQIQNIKLYGGREQLFSIDNFQVELSISPLLHGEIHIHNVAIDKFEYFSLNPEKNQKKETPSKHNFEQLMSLKLPAVIVENFRSSVIFEKNEFNIYGSLDTTQYNIDLSLTNLAQAELVRIKTSYTDPNIKLNLEVNEDIVVLFSNKQSELYQTLPLRLESVFNVALKDSTLKIQSPQTNISTLSTEYNVNGSLKIDENGVIFDTLRLLNEDGTFILNGLLGQNQNDLKITISDFVIPDSIITNDKIKKVKLDADIFLKDSIFNPTLQSELKAGVYLNTSEQAENISSFIHSKVNLAGGKIKSTLLGYVNDNLFVNCQVVGRLEDLFQEPTFDLKISSESDLSKLNNLIGQDTRHLKGNVDTQFHMKSKPDEKFIYSGKSQIKNLCLFDEELGLDADQINAHLIFKQPFSLYIDKFDGKINQGTIDIEGNLGLHNLNLNFNGQNIRLSKNNEIFDYISNLLISGYGNLSGNYKNPIVDLSVKATGTTYLPSFEASNDLIAELKVQTDKEQFVILGNMHSNGHELIKANAKLQINDFQNLFGSQINLEAKLNGQLEPISTLLNESFDFKGFVDTKLILKRENRENIYEGYLSLSNGHFKDDSLGIELPRIDLESNFDPNALILQKAVIKGKKGEMNLSGGIRSLRNKPFIDIQLNLNDFKPLNSETYDALINGQVNLTGLMENNTASGKLIFDEVNIDLPNNMSNVSKINTIDKKTLESKTEASKKTSTKAITKLDLEMKFPNRIFVRGNGLDAELGGNFNVKGSNVNPTYDGKIKVKRGTYTFLNKIFKIKFGELWIIDDNIHFNFTTESKSKDLTVLLKLTGTPDNVKIKLSSNPTLPEDEIIARLLFGKDIQKLSPIQALQLAHSIKQLTSTSSNKGLDFYSKTRNLLKVDELNINSSDDNNLNIEAGKYVSEKIYLKGQQGITSQDTKITVEYEVTDNISIESSTGTGSTSNDIKIFWKKDF